LHIHHQQQPHHHYYQQRKSEEYDDEEYDDDDDAYNNMFEDEEKKEDVKQALETIILYRYTLSIKLLHRLLISKSHTNQYPLCHIIPSLWFRRMYLNCY